jgi:vacuolar protein sorting-associated protein 13A/C
LADGDVVAAKSAVSRRHKLDSDLESRRKSLTTTEKDASYTTRFITSILNNLVVNVEAIHIRYEDESANPAHPFACGLILESFSINTTDPNFKTIPFHADLVKLYKCVQLSKLGVYWHSDIPTAPAAPTKPVADHDYILHPVSLTAHIKMVKSKAVESGDPALTIDATVDHIGLSLEPNTARDVQKLMDALSVRHARAAHIISRPRVPSYRGHYAAWWVYAINENLKAVRKRRRCCTLEGLTESVRLANEYAALFRRGLGVLPVPALSADEKARVLAIEDTSSDEFIAAVRNSVQHAVVRDAHDVLEAARARAQAQKKGGFFSGFGLFRSSSSSAGPAADGDAAEVVNVAGIQFDMTIQGRQRCC